jgi:hypothetical protein
MFCLFNASLIALISKVPLLLRLLFKEMSDLLAFDARSYLQTILRPLANTSRPLGSLTMLSRFDFGQVLLG